MVVAYLAKMLVSGVGNSGTVAASMWPTWLARISAWMLLPPTDTPAAMEGLTPFMTVMSPAMLPVVMMTGGLASEVERMLASPAGMPAIGFLVSMVTVPLEAMPLSKKLVGRSEGS